MTGEQFAYWLHGFVGSQRKPPTPEQWRNICDHLIAVVDKDGRYLRLHTGHHHSIQPDDELGRQSEATGY